MSADSSPETEDSATRRTVRQQSLFGSDSAARPAPPPGLQTTPAGHRPVTRPAPARSAPEVPRQEASASAPDSPARPARAAAAGSGTASAGAERGAPERTTPMMEQYLRAKAEAPEALLFFRMGDFYELFGEDARVAARELGIALTSRSKGEGALPMAGVPVRAHEAYLQQLIRAGHRVAICDQTEDPKLARGLVERAVTRIVTAGTVFEDDLLDRRASNWLVALFPAGAQCGLAWLDVSTGEFRVADVPLERVADEISRLDPAEIVLPESLHGDLGEAARAGRSDALALALRRASAAPLVAGPEWTFLRANAQTALLRQLGVGTLAGFGLTGEEACVCAAGAVLAYVRETQRGNAPPVSSLRLHDTDRSAALDRATRACLELLETQRERQREGSLLSVLDRTGTAMGARRLREWLVTPLSDPARITRRQGAVAELVARRELHGRLVELLDGLPDLERIATRLLAGRGGPRDLAALRNGLRRVPELKQLLSGCDALPLADAAARLDPLAELRETLERALVESPPAAVIDGGLIARGYHARLDELVALREDGASAVARFQAEESARSGIPSLKVGYNRVFGYYIEITHAHAARVPDEYTRKQTLAGAERYITPELKRLESAILGADEEARATEARLFTELRERAATDGEALRALARGLARVDVLSALAAVARERGWTRPVVDDGDLIEIADGRHPVLEALLPPGRFVPNDVRLDRDSARLLIVTGPNMAGKSTYIRQVALLVLLAQVGSFVPAASAQIGCVDRIFTRLGSADDLSGGASTFMVEMTETASILNTAGPRSLVLLDEVGRGTSTWDGLALAWSICEYLYLTVGARSLFATHYHELVDLADELPAVRNLNVAVHEQGDEVVFLHRIVPGGTDRSYGLHVARLAGVPQPVIERARRILHDLETRAPDLRPAPGEAPAGAEAAGAARDAATHLAPAPLFPRPGAAVLDEIAALDPDSLSPLDALLLLRRLRARLTGGDDAVSGEAARD